MALLVDRDNDSSGLRYPVAVRTAELYIPEQHNCRVPANLAKYTEGCLKIPV